MSRSHLERAADAAAYADRLHADLARLSLELERHRGAADLESLRERSAASRRQLELIAARLHALRRQADAGRYPLSEAENLALETALDLRDRMQASLARNQGAARRGET